MSIKKITISQLSKGMFVHELDISWMKSPFLRHRRKIKTPADIALLKKAGVKRLYIDLSRGVDIQSDSENNSPGNETSRTALIIEDNIVEETAQSEPEIQVTENNASEKVPLSEELQVAARLQNRIGKLVNQLTQLVKQGQPISVANINPIISESLDSIARNDQALLTLLHLNRQDIKLSDHSFGVFSLILPLALKLDCSLEEINELAMAALLHDIGWARLPMHLLDKKKPYTGAEKQLTQQHIPIVENILIKSGDVPDRVKQLVAQHHEYNDGSGYPKKLGKGKIHKLTQILQLADFYDESIHGLMGQAGMLPASALKRLYQLAKKGLYSETLVGEMIHVMGIFPLTSAVELSSGEKALVVEIDKHKPLLPKVKIVYQADGQICQKHTIINLALQDQDNKLKIIKVIDPIDKKNDPLGLLIVHTSDFID